MEIFKKTVAMLMVLLTVFTILPMQVFAVDDMNLIPTTAFEEGDKEKMKDIEQEAVKEDSSNNNSENEIEAAEKNAEFKLFEKTLLKTVKAYTSGADSASSDKIKVTVKAKNKSTGEDELVPGATVTLYVGSQKKKTATTGTSGDEKGIAEISLDGLSIEERKIATVSAYKTVGSGKAIDGTGRDLLFSAYANNSDDYTRYKYELHSETIDEHGNWLGAEIPKSKESNKVDIVFAIDATGSMSGEINNVRTNLSYFAQKLISEGLDIRFGIIEYRDTTCGEPTKVHTFNGSKWCTELSSVTGALSKIYATGGGDGPETVIDALGMVASSSMYWRSSAHKFAFVLTDANYKTNNGYGYSSLSQVADKLKEKEIYTSVITSSSYSGTYSTLYNKTGGIYANINSSSFRDEMMNLADSIIEETTREMELKLSEPRIKFSMSVCYLANNEESRSASYLSSLKTMLNEYAHDVSETSDGHFLIDKILLFSTDERMDFFETDERASMADIQIQTLVNDDGKGLSNVTIHSNAYPAGYYVSSTISSQESIDNFSKLKDASEYDGKFNFRRIQMSGKGVHNFGNESFIDEPKTYAETLTHETGHYFFWLYDEYLDKDGNSWGDNYSKPFDEYGLMDHQNTDIEMSKSRVDYAYFGSTIPNDESTRHTNQSMIHKASCEDTIAELAETGCLLGCTLLENIGKYEAVYTKALDHDRTAYYSFAGLSDSDYLSLPATRIRSAAGLSKTIASTVDSSYFENLEASEVLIGDCNFSLENDIFTIKLTASNGSRYSVYVADSETSEYEKITQSGTNSNPIFSIEYEPGKIYELKLVKESDKATYNTLYVDFSNETEKGYIYKSVGQSVAAYASNDSETVYAFVSENSKKTNGDYISVNQSTYINTSNGTEITGGEIYSVAYFLENIDYTTLSWFVYKDGKWTKLDTDYSSEENYNIGARADIAGEGLYVLMAKPAPTGKIDAVTDIGYSISDDVDGKVSFTFNDSSDNAKFYNIYYSENEFDDVTDDGVHLQTFVADDEKTEYSFTVGKANSDYYVGVEVIAENGSKSELAMTKITTGEADSDGDGIPDWYCDKYLLWGMPGESKNISGSDDDGDGLSNLEEYLGGSNPKNINDPVRVTEIPVESISVSLSSHRMLIKTSKSITATVSPDNASNKEIVWASEDESIVKVSGSGNSCEFTAVGTGTTNVVAVTEDGGYAATCKVTVYCVHSYSSSWTVDNCASFYSSGSKSHHCIHCGARKDTTSISGIKDVALDSYSFYCDGTAKKPTVKLIDYNGKVLKDKTDYVLTYSSEGKTSGRYNVRVDLKGNYSGSRTYYYDVSSSVSGLGFTETGYTGATLSWSLMKGASGYKVYRKLSTDLSYKQIGISKVGTYTDKTVVPNKEYNYIVRPYNSKSTGTDSRVLYLNTILRAPSYLNIYNDDYDTLKIYIRRSTSNATGYQLYRSTSANGKYSLIKTTNADYYYDTGLTFGKEYYYKARAFFKQGSKTYYSDYTSVSYGKTSLSYPYNVKAVSAGEKKVYLSWDAVDGAQGYDIYRSTYWSGDYLKVKSTASLNYTDTSVSPDNGYYYKVVAYRKSGSEKICSGMSSYSYVKPSFSAPYNVEVKNSGLSTHILSYKKPAGAKGVEIYCNSGNGYELIKKTTAESYTFKNRESTKYYYYQVRAYKTVNKEVVYTPYYSISHRSVLPAPKNVKAKNTNATTIDLSWSAVKDATIYYIYRATSLNGSYYQIGSSEKTSYTDINAYTDYNYYYKVEARRSVNGYINYGIYSEPVKKIAACAPTKITSTAPESMSSVRVSWKKSSEAVSYKLYRATSKTGKYSLVKSGIKTNYYIDKSLKFGTTYYYKVVVVGEPLGVENISDYSAAVSGKTGLKKPTVKAAAKTVNSITVSWNRNSEATGYYLYRATSKKGKYTRIATITKNKTVSYTDSKLKAGKTYYYKLEAYKKSGKKIYSSKASSVVSAKAVPAAVTNLEVTSTTVSSVKLTWKKNTAADGYYVYRATSKKGKYSLISTIKKNKTVSYTNSKLKAGTTYYYKVVAYKKYGGKTYTSAATSPVAGKAVPKAVSGAKVSKVSKSSVKLSWSKNTTATGYYIYRSETKSGSYSKIATITKNSTVTYTDSKLKTGKTYYYKIVSYKAVSGKAYNSAASAVLTAKTK